MIFDYLSKAQDTFKNRGFFPLLSIILNKLLSYAFYTNSSIWLIKDLNDVSQRFNGFINYEINFNDLNTITEWMKEKNTEYSWMYSEKEISVAREYGHLIPFLKHNNEIIGYTKVALGKVYIRDYNSLFSLAPNKAMFYDTTFLPDYRGKKLPRYLKNEIFSYLKNRKIDYIYAHIEPWNIASIKSNEGVSFKAVWLNRYIRIFWFKYHSNNPSKLLS